MSDRKDKAKKEDGSGTLNDDAAKPSKRTGEKRLSGVLGMALGISKEDNDWKKASESSDSIRAVVQEHIEENGTSGKSAGEELGGNSKVGPSLFEGGDIDLPDDIAKDLVERILSEEVEGEGYSGSFVLGSGPIPDEYMDNLLFERGTGPGINEAASAEKVLSPVPQGDFEGGNEPTKEGPAESEDDASNTGPEMEEEIPRGYELVIDPDGVPRIEVRGDGNKVEEVVGEDERGVTPSKVEDISEIIESEGEGQPDIIEGATEVDDWFRDNEEPEKEPVELGTGKYVSPEKQENEATVAGEETGPVEEKKSKLSGTDLFAEFNNDPERENSAEEGSDARILDSVIERDRQGNGGSGPQVSGTGKPPQAEYIADVLETTNAGEDGVDPNGKTEYAPATLSTNGRRRARVSEIARKVNMGRVPAEYVAYGDILYEIELTAKIVGLNEDEVVNLDEILEKLGKMPGTAIELLRSDVDSAIESLEGIEIGKGAREGEFLGGNPEARRLEKLMVFKADVLGKDGEEGWATLEYALWLKNEREKFEGVVEAFGVLGVSPSEHSREAVIDACNLKLGEKDLGDSEKRKLERLQKLLVPEKGRDTEADLSYNMLRGYTAKRTRERVKELEVELAKYKVTREEFESKKEQMVNVLTEVLVLTQDVGMGADEIKPRIIEALKAIDPDGLKRNKYVKLITDAQQGKGIVGRNLSEEAKKRARSQMKTAIIAPEGISSANSQESMDGLAEKLHSSGGVPRTARSINGKAKREITMPFWTKLGVAASVIANLAFGGFTLYKQGQEDAIDKMQRMLGQEDAIAEVVEEVQEVAGLPAGVVEEDANNLENEEIEAPAGSGPEPEEKEDVEGENEGVVEDAELEEEASGDEIEGYPRTREGLEEALDDWCNDREADLGELQKRAKAEGEDRKPFVETGMVREAYRAIEPQLDGSVNPYDIGGWEKMLLGKKYPNKVVELAIMSDLWTTQLPPEARYAAGLRLSLLLGKRAGRPGKYDFSRAAASARNNGIPLPKIVADTLLGDIEGTSHAVGRCTSASLMRSVISGMQTYKQEATGGSKAKERAFMKDVKKLLGRNARRLIKAWEGAVEEGKHEAKKDVCKTATKDRIGRDGAKCAKKKDGFWKRLSKKRSRRKRAAQKEADEITGELGNDAKKQKIAAPPKADKKYGKQSSYRGGIGGNKGNAALRRAKKEAYLEQFRFRGGVEKKASPFKGLASKLRIGKGKGLGRATAQA